MNFQALLEHKQQPSSGDGAALLSPSGDGVALLAPSTPGDIGRSPSPSRDSFNEVEVTVVTYACSAVQGFFKSIALSLDSSLQDTLRCVGGCVWMVELSGCEWVHVFVLVLCT